MSLRAQISGRVFFTILAIAVLGIFVPGFCSWTNVGNILAASTVIGILALGATLVIASGGLDLSVGSVLALASVAGGLAAHYGGGGALGVVLAALGAGAAAGAVNGWLIARVGVMPFVATLAMLGVARGLALVFTDARTVYGLPASLVWLGQGRVAGLPVVPIIFLALAVIVHVLLFHTRFGRHVLVIGDNPRAARAAGVPVARRLCSLYILSGILAAAAGIVWMGRVNAGDPNAGAGYELIAITAVVIGGTPLSGGRASVLGSVLGAIFLAALQNAMNLLAIPSYYQPIAAGVLLMAAACWQLAQQKEQV